MNTICPRFSSDHARILRVHGCSAASTSPTSLNELHGVCEHLEPLARSWELKRWRLQWRNGWIRLAKKLEKLLAGHPWRKNKLRWGGRPYFLSTLRIDSQRLASMERDYPGITAQIHRYDCCDLPTCPNCCSNDTAAVHVGLVGRSMNIAFATTKFRLLANGPKPGAYYCNQCGRYFDGSNEKQFAIRLTKWAILSIAIGALTAFVGYNSRPPNHNAPSDSTVAQSPEMRRAIPAEPEIRKAMPVQTKEPEVDRGSELIGREKGMQARNWKRNYVKATQARQRRLLTKPKSR
jgi:hypothetical protein